jgi:hydroxyethylthiazole kinase
MLKKILMNLESKTPLVHNITNYVTVNDCANIVLASGGAPLMADELEEVEDIVSISSALYINVGTLNKRTIKSMILAGQKANKLEIPVVLDPVGMGASKLRSETVKTLVENIKFDIIKGNFSEVKSLYEDCKNEGGVDATSADILKAKDLSYIADFAKKASVQFESIIAITGEVDCVSDGQRVAYIENGHSMMTKITGTGCMTGSMMGVYAAVSEKNYFESAVLGLVTMGCAGEIANEKIEKNDEGTASFKRYLIDEVSKFDVAMLEKRGRYDVR